MDVCTGKSMKYSQLLTGMKAVASALRKRGLATGDNVVAISGNHIELPLLSMAVWRAGGTQSCLSVNLPQGYHKLVPKRLVIIFLYSFLRNFVYVINRCDGIAHSRDGQQVRGDGLRQSWPLGGDCPTTGLCPRNLFDWRPTGGRLHFVG